MGNLSSDGLIPKNLAILTGDAKTNFKKPELKNNGTFNVHFYVTFALSHHILAPLIRLLKTPIVFSEDTLYSVLSVALVKSPINLTLTIHFLVQCRISEKTLTVLIRSYFKNWKVNLNMGHLKE